MSDLPKPNHAAHAASEIVLLAIDRVRPDPAQPRRHFDDARLAELAASIAAVGVAQPILVASRTAGDYTLLAGERRWRAAQRAGLTRLPAVVRDDLDTKQRAVFGLIENLQRESLSVMETAHGLARLADDHGMTHAAIAERIGKSRVYVSNLLRLCQLEPTVQALVDSERLSLGHAKILAGLARPRQRRLADKVIRRGLSVRRLERLVADAATGGEQAISDRAPGDAPDLSNIERALSAHVGNTVRVDYDACSRRGELRIAFHDLDEFDGLLARLGYCDR